ncbi:MAG: hypothetical protein HWE09_00815 [Cyclobacteriaceae bacterium]|uniref:hypothetical protein n=1 Tax=Algoriphagus sp. TaxID=1872435 RepID=UPI00184E6BE9|nr:hypothetical protein [Algoriphagus sp.]NVJ85125.1 hypothetical protein [Algoriphagus sp.]NVK48276.1 hypothetical protein [Cyclobacteriaceae bacterium]
MKNITTLVIVALLTTLHLSAQTFEEWANLDDKKFEKTAAEVIHNTFEVKKFALSDEDLPKFEKIGLLSFSVFDPASFEKTNLYSYQSITMSQLGGIYLIDAIFKKTYFPMNDRVHQNHDVYILLPDNYNDTDQKKKIYEDTEFEISGLFKATAAAEKKIRGGLLPDVKVDIPGLKRVGYANADPKIWRAVGKLAGELDLDAFLIIENYFTSDKKGTYLTAVTMTLIGPNPVPYREENEKKFAPIGPLKGYLEGLVLGSIRMEPPKEAIKVITYTDGMGGINIDGMDLFYSRMVDYLLTDTKEAFDEIRK